MVSPYRRHSASSSTSYSRLGRTSLAFPGLARVMIYIFNIAIVLAALSSLAGMNSSKEYSELEWPLDIGVVNSGDVLDRHYRTIMKRKKNRCMSRCGTFWPTWSRGHCVHRNNIAMPVSWFKSYSAYAGANDCQRAVVVRAQCRGFLLFTTIPLAVFYYILPRQQARRSTAIAFSIVGFWALVFAYLWTGAHHLIYTPLRTGSRPLPSRSASF